MTKSATALVLGLLCVWPAVRANEADLMRLEAARALWDSAQDGSYRYSYLKYCECYRDTPPTTVVVVGNGQIERVYHLLGELESEVPARDGSSDFYWTVDDLFDKLEAAYALDAAVRVEFDAERGYPLSLFIDYDDTFVGDETDLRLTALEIL